MSDSDEDLMPDRVLKYLHDKSGVHTRRPNINNTHITSFSIRNHNKMTSTFNMENYERQSYRGTFDQRSMCYRRERSPMSLRLFPDPGIQNFHNSYYPRGTSSQRSVFNRRSGSPISVRSIDSNASVSAADIALAFKNVKFNKYDLRLIKEAYNKFMKNRIRKRIEKRRNLKLFLKNTRREAGDDSGEQGSDSSISSDDCRSSRTAIYKENLPLSRSKTLRTDITNFRTTIKESGMYKDCTENIKQNSLRNMLAVSNNNDDGDVSAVANTTIAKPQNTNQFTLKERFAKRNAFVLPSQRFNKPGLKTNPELLQSKSNAIQNGKMSNNDDVESCSENEDIFSQGTMRENMQGTTLLERKRYLDTEDTNCTNIKRKKLTLSPIKHNNKSLTSSTLINSQNKDFTFKKPQMPVRKSVKAKDKDTIFTDTLISKSAPPVVDDFEPDFSLHKKKQNRNIKDVDNSTQKNPQNITEIEDTNNLTEITQNTTDVSMKPSFIKRKLFSQKLDILDKKNLSSDNLALNSPQTKLYAGEKNRVRKLVTSQSCLNRDVFGEDNVLDLIHKIVPQDQMNITNATNKKDSRRSQDDDKWDVTSVISMCNNDDISDTYTDEEIFKASQKINKSKSKNDANKPTNTKSETNKEIAGNKVVNKKLNDMAKNKNAIEAAKLSQCRVVLENLQQPIANRKDICDQSYNKRVSSCVKSFWDTDLESDMEDRPHFARNSKLTDGKDHQNNAIVNNTMNLNKKNGLKGAILTVRSSQNKGINSSRSDRSRVSQRKNLNNNNENKEPVSNETYNKNPNCKTNLNNTVTEEKRKRGRSKSINTKKLTPRQKGVSKEVSKSKETSNLQKITDNNSKKKNGTVNKTRILTPRKVNEKKRQSSPKSNQSSFDCSSLSSRSLRIRRKPVDFKSML